MSKKLMHLLIMYHEVHRLSREGFNMSYISRQMGLNRRTVKKILSMSEEQYLDYKHNHTRRKKLLAPYEDFVRTRLENCPEASAAQVHDWLKEHHEDFVEVNEKTVFNFVLWVRNEHGIPKPFHHRDYAQVEELPYGQQAQADFGQYNMQTEEGGRKKVYFMSMVLSRSRHKYVVFQDEPFTTLAAIDGHEKCFQFFMGIPEQLVYDQDKLLLHDENKGKLVLTQEFRKYVYYRGFKLHFCRKGDPESKGKVENVIRYIKYNFLRGRTYIDADTLNGQAGAWLHRTANAKVHAATKKIPQEEWLIEQQYLQPIVGLVSIEQTPDQYTVRKDNTIAYKSNFYQLPLGTYQGRGTTVGLKAIEGHIVIYGAGSEEITCYEISPGKGKLISHRNFKRDYSAKIEELMEELAKEFEHPGLAKDYFELIRRNTPRYIRDQLLLIRKLVNHYGMEVMNPALDFCMKNNILKAADMESLAKKLAAENKPAAGDEHPPIEVKTIAPPASKIVPQKSDISDYQNLMD